MDTLEFGPNEVSASARRWPRPSVRWPSGPSVAVWLAGAGVALGVIAELLPWVGVKVSGGSSTGLSLDSINTIPVLAYYLCWIGLLGLAGLALTGRPATRRAAAGAAFGVGAALVMVLAGIVRAVLVGDRLGELATSTDSTGGSSPSVGPGLFCACLAVGLVLAGVLVGVRRPAPLAAVRARPVQPVPAPPDEPPDLTVMPAEPIELEAPEPEAAGQPLDLASLAPPVDGRMFSRPGRG